MSVRVGVVGTGWGAGVQVPAFRAAGLEVTALWARSEEKARAKAGELGIGFATDDWRRLVEHPAVDLVTVTTPPHTHHEISVAALAAGKHVLCEKPFALDAREAAEMAGAARARADRLALVDHELRFVPVRRRLRELVAGGFVGELRTVELTVWSPMRLDPERRWDWWSDAAAGGGILGALGSHHVDFVQWLTGRRVEAVSARLGTIHRELADERGERRAVTADDVASIELWLAGGAGGHLLLDTGVAAPPVERLRLSGTGGTLVLENGVLRGQEAGTREDREIARPDEELPAGLRANSDFHRGTLWLGRALAAALGEGRTEALADAATFEDGLAVQRVLDAARESARRGGRVEVAAAEPAAGTPR
ncbi:MAG TPA: Gfo/Idh/MocA family oxidoreductase [Thermoanaerobaculia bacterium]|nr:Gfo/Idh/MocA family oxidoreductase [Thermoanaerobaculia bacterium]